MNNGDCMASEEGESNSPHSGHPKHQTEQVRGRSDAQLDAIHKSLEDRVKLTYYSRLQTAKRMQLRTLTWNAYLVVSSIVTTIISIVLLVDPNEYGKNGPAMLVILGVATFAASLLVTTANYSARSEVFFRGYRDLQRLWTRIDQISSTDEKKLLKLENRYQQLLDELPNHSETDYLISVHNLRKKDLEKPVKERENKYSPTSAINFFKIISSLAFSYLPIALAVLTLSLLNRTLIWLLK